MNGNQDFLGTGWGFPILVGAHGGLRFSHSEASIEESIWLILSTAPGERVMRPDFGCGIHEYVFEPNTPTTHGTLAQLTREALTRFEPRIDLESVRVSAAPDAPQTMLIRIDYRVRSSNTTHNMVYPFYVSEGQGV